MKKIKVLMLIMFFVISLTSTSGLVAGEKEVKCVSCSKMVKKSDSIEGKYEGKTYYFDSKKCKEAFLKNPKKMLAKYTCPMASCKTFSEKPGKCPKCGMNLKEMKGKKIKHGKEGKGHKDSKKKGKCCK